MDTRLSCLDVFYISHWKKHRTCTEGEGECKTWSQKSFLDIHAPVNYFSYAKHDSLNRRNREYFLAAIIAVPWRCGVEFCYGEENAVYGALDLTGML